MFGLPSHNIYLVKVGGSRENVMSTDCSTKAEVMREVKYLFDKCGYHRGEYIKAQYTKNGNILYEFELSELEG